MAKQILVSGESLVDMIPDSERLNSFQGVPGGSPFNVARALGRLGVPVVFLGRFSRDRFGDLLCETLRESGVGLDYARRVDALSTLGFVRPSARGGGPDYAFYTTGTAGCELAVSDIPQPFAESVRIVHVGSFSLAIDSFSPAIDALLAQATQQNRLVAVDLNIRPFLIGEREPFLARLDDVTRSADVIKLSDEDLAWLHPGMSVERYTEQMLGRGAALVVVTRGKDGVYGATQKVRVNCVAPEVDVVDTVGAGDTLQAALLGALLEAGWDTGDGVANLGEAALEQALGRAVMAAAINCQSAGCVPPTRDALDRMMKG